MSCCSGFLKIYKYIFISIIFFVDAKNCLIKITYSLDKALVVDSELAVVPVVVALVDYSGMVVVVVVVEEELVDYSELAVVVVAAEGAMVGYIEVVVVVEVGALVDSSFDIVELFREK